VKLTLITIDRMPRERPREISHRPGLRIARAVAAVVAGALAIIAAAFPGAASAALNPALAVVPVGVASAGQTGSLQLTIGFGQSAGDAAKDFTIALPSGLLINQQIDGGACLSAATPAPQCQIGSGTATIAGVPAPITLYLIKSPAANGQAGVELVGGPLSVVGQLAFRSLGPFGVLPSALIGTQISFSGLPPSPVSALNITLTDLTLPSSCRPAPIVLSATSQQVASVTQTVAQYGVTGCTSLAYAPKLTERVTRYHPGTTGTMTVKLTVPAGDSTTKSMSLPFPPTITLNPKLDACFNGTACTVGTVTASSPPFAPGLFTGSIVLSGTLRAPRLSAVMPAPADLKMLGTISQTSTGLSSMPSMPFTELTLRFTGNSLGRMFVVQCYPSEYNATLTPFSGANPVRVTGAVTQSGCPAVGPRRPQAMVTLTGIRQRAPRLSVSVVQGVRAPKIKTLSIGLPPGLSLAHAGQPPSPAVLGRELGLSNGRVARSTIHKAWISVTLKHSLHRTSLSLKPPLLIETRALAASVRAGKDRTQWLTLGVTDFDGHFTKWSLSVKTDRTVPAARLGPHQEEAVVPFGAANVAPGSITIGG
jgi:hypothetical protein